MESTAGVNESSTLYGSTNTTGSATTESPATPLAASVYLAFFGYLIVFVVTLFGNMLVVVAISKVRFLQNTANTFVAGLAAVDMTMALAVAFRAIQEIDPSAFTDIVSCQLRMISGVSNFISSSLTLLAMSLSRYICTFLPFKSHLVTSSAVKMVLVFCLLYPVIIVTTTSLAFHSWDSHMPCAPFTLYPPELAIFYSSHIFISLSGTGVIYLRILRETARHQRAIAALNVNAGPTGYTDQTADNYRRNIVLLKNLSIIVGIFAVSLSPFSILGLVISLDPVHYLMIPNIVTALKIFSILVFVNSMINPFIYAWRFKPFRAAFKIVLCCPSSSEISQMTEQFAYP